MVGLLTGAVRRRVPVILGDPVLPLLMAGLGAEMPSRFRSAMAVWRRPVSWPAPCGANMPAPSSPIERHEADQS